MPVVKQQYWRLAPAGEADPAAVLIDSQLSGPPEFIQKLSPRVGIVLASWDSQDHIGRVHRLGIVTAVDKSLSVATVDWRRCTFTLSPNPEGRLHWREKHFFKFDSAVAKRYELGARFSDLFSEEASAGHGALAGLSLPADSPRVVKGIDSQDESTST